MEALKRTSQLHSEVLECGEAPPLQQLSWKLKDEE